MRRFLPALPAAALVFGIAGQARAFEVPRYVFEFEKLGEAQTEGYEDKKPLLLLYADPKKKPT